MKSYIKMKKIIIKFEDIEIKKKAFHEHNRPISIKNIEINKIVVSNKVSLVKKDLNLLLATKIPKKLSLYVYWSAWVHLEKTLVKLSMCFLVKDEKLLEKCDEIRKKFKNIIKKECDSELVHNKKCLRAKM